MSRIWDASTLEILKKEYATADLNELSARFGRSVDAVRNKAAKLGLKRDVNTGRFAEGESPWNKYMPGYRAGFKTMFKPGQKPANQAPVGSERVRKGSVWVKVAETGNERLDWALKHQIEWVKQNRAIPSDCIIVFKDRDKTNTHINNLEMMRRGEFLERVSIASQPPEIRSVMGLKAALTRTINEQEKR